MTAIGSFPVLAERGDVDAFRAATGLPAAETVPATFPMRWLAAPAVQEALLALAPEVGLVPVHESQTFDYVTPLTCGDGYLMCLDARREGAPDRLIVKGTVERPDGTVVAQVETILRLFSAAAAQAA